MKKWFWVILLFIGGLVFSFWGTEDFISWIYFQENPTKFTSDSYTVTEKFQDQRNYFKLSNMSNTIKYSTLPETWNSINVGDTLQLFKNEKWPHPSFIEQDRKWKSNSHFLGALMSGILGIFLLLISLLGMIIPSKDFD